MKGAALAGLIAISPAVAAAEVEFFGYVGIMCAFDDPLDDGTITDYSDEVAGFTNANHVCLPADPADWADWLRLADSRFRPILTIEPLFDFEGEGPGGPGDLWSMFLVSLAESGVDPARLILHLADEPTLRGMDMDRIRAAARRVRADLPTAEVMIIEACSMDGPPPVPPEVTLWGFDCYTIPDPAASVPFLGFLRAAQLWMDDGQRMVLVMDANHTPYHEAAGITAEGMADVARAYAELAQATQGVAGVIGYTWPGGIDNDDERGVRNLPVSVIDAHRQVGLSLISP